MRCRNYNTHVRIVWNVTWLESAGPDRMAEWLRHETRELGVLGSNPPQVNDCVATTLATHTVNSGKRRLDKQMGSLAWFPEQPSQQTRVAARLSNDASASQHL